MKDTSARVHEAKISLIEEHFLSIRISKTTRTSRDTELLIKILDLHARNPNSTIKLNNSENSALKSAKVLIEAQLCKMSYMEIFWLKFRIKLNRRAELAKEKAEKMSQTTTSK